MTENSEPRCNISQVGKYLGVPPNTLYSWHARHYGPPARRVGKHLRYDPVEVQEWYYRQPVGVAV
jgi:DNA-binding transcriptional MerR regulator